MSNKKDLSTSSIKLIKKIKLMTEAGILLNNIEVLEKLERKLVKLNYIISKEQS